MQAVVYEKYGSPDVLELKEVDKPTCRDDEVLVKVYATSINAWDWERGLGSNFGQLSLLYKQTTDRTIPRNAFFR